MKKHEWGVALLTALALGLIGCISSQTGKEGLLEFNYVTDDKVTDFNKPIAIGARLDLTVARAGTEGDRRVTLDEASSDDTDVLEVVSTAGDKMIVEGRGAGRAELSATATLTATSEQVTDFIDMTAREPEVVNLWHSCYANGDERQTREARYIAGQNNLWIPFDMEMQNGQSVIGYGRYPVELEPAEGASFVADNTLQSHIRIDGGAVGDLTLASQVDDTTLGVKFVEPGVIDGAEIVLEPLVLQPGETKFAYVLPTEGNQRICQANVQIEVAGTSADTCEVKKASNPSLDATNDPRRFGWLELKATAIGECTFDVTYPEGEGGEGSTTSLSVRVTERVSE
ncbi:MAG: hypothetical protein AAGI01_14910 [Myxococcota bacterium]